MKPCISCHQTLPLSEFYAHPQMKDGTLNKCKACCKACVREREKSLKASDPEWVERDHARHRVKSAKYRAAGRSRNPSPASGAAWRKRNAEKRRAHNIVANAIRAGRLIRENCHCGKFAEAHHEDYGKPLEVAWLCPSHHSDRHVQMRKEARAVKLEGGAV